MEIKELIRRCFRILHISRKPTDEEFQKVAKVTALGMVLFGIVGFVVSVVLNLM